MYSCHFLISFFRSLPFLSFIESIFSWNVHLVSPIFLKRSRLFPILFFPPVFLCIVHLRNLSYLSLLFSGTLDSVGYIFPFLLCILLLFFSVICKASSDLVTFCLVAFLFIGDGFGHCLLYNVVDTVLKAPGLPDLVPWNYLSPPLEYHKGFHLGHIWMS